MTTHTETLVQLVAAALVETPSTVWALAEQKIKPVEDWATPVTTTAPHVRPEVATETQAPLAHLEAWAVTIHLVTLVQPAAAVLVETLSMAWALVEQNNKLVEDLVLVVET